MFTHVAVVHNLFAAPLYSLEGPNSVARTFKGVRRFVIMAGWTLQQDDRGKNRDAFSHPYGLTDRRC
jgi:hypothetical protein